jgi:SAM-dependent methyltransferase
VNEGSFDRVAKIYDATRGLPPQAEAAVADSLSAIFGNAGCRVLEVGVGTGRMAVPLLSRGCRVTGVDIARRMLAALRRKSRGVDIVVGSAFELPFADAAFDGALFVHVLHLVSDPGLAVRVALPKVRSGGVMVFAGEDVPGEGSWRAARALVCDAVREISGIELRDFLGHLRALEAIGSELGSAGTEATRVPLAAWEFPFSGAGFLAQLEGRQLSWMWQIPDADLPAVVERVRAGLSERFGDLEPPRRETRSMSALVARLR